MKNLLYISLLLASLSLVAQDRQESYQNGEFLKFRVHYGFVTAGYATLAVEEKSMHGENVNHVKGYGTTTGMSRFFFKVEDQYESYINTTNDRPYRFIRNIDEGGHTKDFVVDFDHDANKAYVLNRETNKEEIVHFPKDAQDMVSSFYYLRNNLNTKNIKAGQEVYMDMFMDKEIYKFKLKFLGRETLRTKFGVISSLKFRPYVEAGRVFKEKESLTVWISDDENKIPLLIKADLAVGSLKATLTEFKGLKHPFEMIMD